MSSKSTPLHEGFRIDGNNAVWDKCHVAIAPINKDVRQAPLDKMESVAASSYKGFLAFIFQMRPNVHQEGFVYSIFKKAGNLPDLDELHLRRQASWALDGLRPIFRLNSEGLYSKPFQINYTL
uniref:Uncharacterized protein n=1 Tax=Cannabis sativa TaxID=3483 RepID=A0A803QG25_CANSA